MKIYAGLWTPGAAVLCWECHGPSMGPHRKGPTDEEYATYCEPLAPDCWSAECLCLCQKCGRDIDVRHEDVAQLRRIQHLAGRGDMEQTGGMCAAMSVVLSGGTLVFSALDGPLGAGWYTGPVHWTEQDGPFGDTDFHDDITEWQALRLVAHYTEQE